MIGWQFYFNLLNKYGGDLSLATEEEMAEALKANPKDPDAALAEAKRAYAKHLEQQK